MLRDDLIAARALIDTPEKWCRYAHDGANGSHCVMGAVMVLSSPFQPRYDDMWAAINDALPDDFSGRIRGFNDHPATTHADVLALFDRAIQAATPEPENKS